MEEGQALAAVLLLVLGSASSLVVATLAWLRRGNAGSGSVAALGLATAGWCGFYALEICAAPVGAKLVFARLQYAGILAIAPSWLAFGIRRSGRLSRQLPLLVASWSCFGAATLALVFTSGSHGLVWRSVALPEGGLGPLRLIHGPWFWVVNGLSQVVVAGGTVLVWMGSGRHPEGRFLMLAAALAPWLGNLAYVTGVLGGLAIDLTPFGFVVATLAVTAAIARHELLDLGWEARAQAFSGLPDAAIVLDARGQIAEMNGAAASLLGLDGDVARGRSLSALGSPAAEAIAGQLRPGLRGRTTVPVRVHAGDLPDRHLDVKETTLGVGTLVVARDTSALRHALDARQAEAEFSERIVTSAPVGIVVCDAVARILAWNPCMERITGLSWGRVAGGTLPETLPFWDAAGLGTLFAAARDGRTSTSAQLPYAIEQTGSSGWVECTFVPLQGGEDHGALLLVHDLTERRRFELEVVRLKEELERHAEALASILPVGVFRSEAQGRLTSVNGRFCEIAGLPTPRVLGRGWLAAVHPDDRVRVLAEWEAAAAGGLDFRSEFRFLVAGGAIVWAAAVATAQRDSLGRPFGHVGVLSDVTAHRDLEQSLRASESLLREVTDAIPGLVFRLRRSPEGGVEVIFASRGTEALLGRPASGLQAELHREQSRIVPADLDRMRRELAASAAHAERFSTEFRLRDGAGLRWIRCLAEPVPQPDGTVVYTGMAWDVSREKEAGERLALLSRAVAATADLVLIADADWRFLWVNPAFESQTGFAAAEVVGRRVGEVIDGGQAPGVLEALDEAVREGRPFRHTFLNRRKDGSLYREEKTITPVLGEDGIVTHFVSTGRDISERLRMEAELRRSETMAAMGRIVAGVSHEVRNPLFSISSLLDVLELEARGLSVGDFQPLVLRLRREVGRLTELMRDLLDYGRPADLEVTRQPMRRMLEETLDACRSRAELAGVSLVLESSPEVALPIDVSRLRQVFENLVQNAVEHSPKGGAVLLREGANDGFMEYSVLDQGPGFSEQDLARLFEPFYTRRRGGTGLGLAIAQRLVQQHGGELHAANRAEGGAVVRVRLPVD